MVILDVDVDSGKVRAKEKRIIWVRLAAIDRVLIVFV